MEVTAPGLSAARLQQILTPKGGGEERFWVCDEKASDSSSQHPSSAVQRSSAVGSFILAETASTRRTAESWSIKHPPTKGSPDPAPEMMQQIHSVAKDSVKCALLRGGMWVFPPGPNHFINPLDSTPSSDRWQGDPHHQEEQMEGSNEMLLGPWEG